MSAQDWLAIVVARSSFCFRDSWRRKGRPPREPQATLTDMPTGHNCTLVTRWDSILAVTLCVDRGTRYCLTDCTNRASIRGHVVIYLRYVWFCTGACKNAYIAARATQASTPTATEVHICGRQTELICLLAFAWPFECFPIRRPQTCNRYHFV